MWKVFTEETIGHLLDLLESTEGVEQKLEHHPEGDVFEHSLQTLKLALREEDRDTDLILAAMIHDVGKKKVSTPGHDNIGAEMLDGLASAKTIWLVSQHMRIWTYLLAEMRKLSKVKELAGHPWFPDLCKLARWDKGARKAGMNSKRWYSREKIMNELNKIAHSRFENN